MFLHCRNCNQSEYLDTGFVTISIVYWHCISRCYNLIWRFVKKYHSLKWGNRCSRGEIKCLKIDSINNVGELNRQVIFIECALIFFIANSREASTFNPYRKGQQGNPINKLLALCSARPYWLQIVFQKVWFIRSKTFSPTFCHRQRYIN